MIQTDTQQFSAELQEDTMMNRSKGMVSIIGAGPGDPELITVKALRRIQQADVIVYDRLISEDLLLEAHPQAKRIYCGKSPGLHHMSQHAIHRTLLQHASNGLHVVRLKGGDPLIFGRGGEEALFLQQHSIRYEIVPGITAAVGAAAGADIPLTHRGMAASFACVTASRAQSDLQMHTDMNSPITNYTHLLNSAKSDTISLPAMTQNKSSAESSSGPASHPVRWDLLACAVDTLAIYMGVSQLEWISAELIHHGRPPATPVAIIENGTTTEQRVLIGTLADIYQIAQSASLSNPALIIVGEVVRVREQLILMQQQAEAMIG